MLSGLWTKMLQTIFLAATLALFASCDLTYASPVDVDEVIEYLCSLCGDAASDCRTSGAARESCLIAILDDLANGEESIDMEKRRGFIGKRSALMEKRRSFLGKRRGFIG
nr:hypothetical transcript [Hymenolepis microstoma]